MLMIERLADLWSSKKPKPSKLWRWLSVALTFAMLVYLIYAFTLGGLRLNQINWTAYMGAILAVLGIYLLSLIAQFLVWARIIGFHRKVNWQDVDIYSRMILMRSLPGGAWQWIGRISMYSGGTNVPTRIVVIGNFLEWILFTLCGAAIFLITLPNPGVRLALASLILGVILLLAIRWQPVTRGWVARFTEACLWVALYTLAWLLATAILYIMVQAVAGPGQLYPLEALKVWSFTGSLGMLVTMLPSSLGVRELSLVWFLHGQLTPSIALLIALMLRIIYTLADAIWGLIGWLISYLVLRRNPPIS
jgi:hypothetical protein